MPVGAFFVHVVVQFTEMTLLLVDFAERSVENNSDSLHLICVLGFRVHCNLKQFVDSVNGASSRQFCHPVILFWAT